MDFASEIKQLVIDTARRTAEEVVERSVDTITSLCARAAERVSEAEALAPRVKAALTFVESAQKAGAIPFIGAATRTMFTTAVARPGSNLDDVAEGMVETLCFSDPHGGQWYASPTGIRLPVGRYSVVLSFYKQD